MADKDRVYVVFENAIEGKNCYLTTDKSTDWHSWAKACVVTEDYATCAKHERSLEDLQWNFYDDGKGNYYIESVSDLAYLSYDHDGNKNTAVKEYSDTNVMTGRYYKKKKYYDDNRQWKLVPAGKDKADRLFYLVTNNNYRTAKEPYKNELYLAIGTGKNQNCRDVVVNTMEFINKKNKDKNHFTVRIETGNPF